MNKTMLITVAIAIPTLVNAAIGLPLGAIEAPAKSQKVIALQGNDVDVGTDQNTTSFPNAGMNTVPTKDVGSDNNAPNPNAPISKPGEAPAYPTAPPYTPGAS